MTGAVVVDASVAVKWLVKEQGSDKALALNMLRLHAPSLLVAECALALWRKVRAGDLDALDAVTRLGALRHAPLTFAADHELAQTAMPLALELGHPIYDCMYIALALELAAPLVTADKKLAGIIRDHMAGRCTVIDLHDIETTLS